MSSAGFSTRIEKKLGRWAAGKSTRKSLSSWLIYMEVSSRLVFWLVGIVLFAWSNEPVCGLQCCSQGTEKWAPQLDDFRPGGCGGHLEDSHVVDHFRRARDFRCTVHRTETQMRNKERKRMKEGESCLRKWECLRESKSAKFVWHTFAYFTWYHGVCFAYDTQRQINKKNYEISQNQGYKT